MLSISTLQGEISMGIADTTLMLIPITAFAGCMTADLTHNIGGLGSASASGTTGSVDHTPHWRMNLFVFSPVWGMASVGAGLKLTPSISGLTISRFK